MKATQCLPGFSTRLIVLKVSLDTIVTLALCARDGFRSFAFIEVDECLAKLY
jgi:hypothetical protein